jgi:hypothetical protein
MTPKGANLEGSDLLEVSTLESGSYVTRSITGQEIIDAAAGGGGVTDVTATAPLVSTGGTTPDISMDGASASNDGFLKSTDWNTFNNKQNALTLTTTGTSGPATLIADTLNIPQYSGGGGGGIHALLTPRSGNIVSNNFSGASFASTIQVVNRIVLSPFIPGKTFTSSNFLIRVFGNVAPLTFSKILIYSELNGNPNTLLYESADLDCSTTGTKTALNSFTFTAGTIYWLGYWSNSNPQIFTTAAANMYAIRILGAIPNPSNIVSVILPYGSAPTTITGTSEALSTMPFIGITQA